VTYQASVFNAMVMTATAIEAHSNRFGVKKRIGNNEIPIFQTPFRAPSVWSIKDFTKPV
jgi:hypothetical protein